MKKLFTIVTAVAMLIGCATEAPQTVDYAAKVNPKIGSGGHGHVFVGANVPFGMTQVGPTSITQEWDWCSGYHDSENSVIGFSHTHLSGTGCGDLFDVRSCPLWARWSMVVVALATTLQASGARLTAHRRS